MARPQFAMTINLGHLLQITSLVIAATVGWVTMDARTTANAVRIAKVEAREGEHFQRLRAVENMQARNDERMTSILGYLSRIDARLERMEGNK